MKIPDDRHNQACAIERSALTDGYNSPEHMATYWLSLACALLTSTNKDEREAGKAMVRKWKRANVCILRNWNCD